MKQIPQTLIKDCYVCFMAFLFFMAPFFGIWYVDSSVTFLETICYAGAFMMPIFILKKRFAIYATLYFVLFYVPALLTVGHQFLFNSPLNVNSVFSVFATNAREVITFLGLFTNKMLILIVVTALLLFFCVCRLCHKPGKGVSNVGLGLCFVGICVLFFKLQVPLPLIPLINHYHVYKHIENDLISTQQSDHHYDSILGVTDTPQTYVIVIGESVYRGALSLYGYSRETTPFMDKQQDLIVFQNVVSPHAVTMTSLQKALTLADDNDMSPAWKKGSLIQFLKDAGYKTYWISNQEEFGLFANLVSVLAQGADETSFPQGSNHDEALLPKFQKALADKANKKVIFVHLSGSHYEYKDRYPKKDDYFKAGELKGTAAVRAHYDNSIRYTDSVLNQMLTAFQKDKNAAAFLYFADHGEDVSSDNSCFCHEEGMKTPEMFEVPFVLWLSAQYALFQPDKTEQIQSQVNEPFNTQYLMETVIDLMGLSHPDIDSSRSLFAKKQEKLTAPAKKLSLDSLGGGGYLWLHMANSSQRLTAYWDEWIGFEIDVFWNEKEKTFRVSHDTMDGEETLEELWENRPDISSKHFWLDFKNMTPVEAQNAVDELNRLTSLHSIPKTHIIVEGKDGMTLTKFTQSGYLTSLYLSCYRWTNPTDKKFNMQRDFAVLASSHIHFVSADARFFQDVMTFFTDYPKLFWNLSGQPDRLNEVMRKHSDEIYVILNEDKKYLHKPAQIFWN